MASDVRRCSVSSTGSNGSAKLDQYLGYDADKVARYVNQVIDGAPKDMDLVSGPRAGSPLAKRKIVPQPPAPPPKNQG